MSTHINARSNDIAETVLLPGDPMRAKYIAETMLEDAFCYNDVRGMLGFTGVYKGKKISIQSTGMGIPSAMIYIHELITEYNAKTLIRIGTCGAIQENISIREIIIPMSCSTTSSLNSETFGNSTFAPTANFDLLNKAFKFALENNINVKVGSILTTDKFYTAEDNWCQKWANYGVLAVEMETAGLYTLAAKHKVAALSILTVSDNLSDKPTSYYERQQSFNEMADIALGIV